VKPGYAIHRAAPEHLAALPAIERAAARLFEGMGLPDEVMNDATGAAGFREACEEGLLWVALAPGGAAVGFALVEQLGDCAHLEELDVHPDHGRRGVGAALVRAVCDWAREEGLPGVTLTTFRDVPWNAPFYTRLGFREIPSAERSAELAEQVRDEATRGLDPARRAVMRFDTRVAA